MRNLTACNGRWFKRFTATGLMPLLPLVGLPGCVAGHMLDWSRVQHVRLDAETHVRLYNKGASAPVKGRFLSATENSLTLKYEDGQTGTFQRKGIRRILRYREWGHRWPG